MTLRHPGGRAYPGAWNGSLWTLYFEFICYLLVAVMGFIPLVRKTLAGNCRVHRQRGPLGQYRRPQALRAVEPGFELAARLVPFFLGGAVVHAQQQDRHPQVAGPAAIVRAGLSIFFVDGFGGPACRPFIAYGSAWIPPGCLRAGHCGPAYDISYGAYIYAFPVQQLLAVFGAYHWGVWWFTLAATLCTIPLAAASWFLIERPVMRRAKNAG